MNLAKVIAQTGRRVTIVDGDLRRPSLHRAFGLANDIGLSSVILGRSDGGTTAVRRTKVPGISLLTSGPLPRYPAELLSSSSMQSLVADLVEQSDIVLFDSPPVLATSDALGLAPLVDGVILVVARAVTTDRQVQTALQRFEQVGARVLGAVLNRAKSGDGAYGTYYHYQPSGVEAKRTHVRS